MSKSAQYMTDTAKKDLRVDLAVAVALALILTFQTFLTRFLEAVLAVALDREKDEAKNTQPTLKFL